MESLPPAWVHPKNVTVHFEQIGWPELVHEAFVSDQAASVEVLEFKQTMIGNPARVAGGARLKCVHRRSRREKRSVCERCEGWEGEWWRKRERERI